MDDEYRTITCRIPRRPEPPADEWRALHVRLFGSRRHGPPRWAGQVDWLLVFGLVWLTALVAWLVVTGGR